MIKIKLLNYKKTERLLKKYNLPLAKSKFYDITEKIKFPVVLKVEGILHKTEEGAVKIINNKLELENFIKKFKKNILMQEFIKGNEVIVGSKKDPQFGNVIMFGLGGIFVEVLKDISFRICPVNKKDALDMIKEIKGFKVLQGYRGEKANINKIADIIVETSNLVEKENIEEIDFNPVIVNNKEAKIVDAKIIK